MLRDLLTSRWLQGGLVFFLVCVGGSLLYSWHIRRTTEAEFGDIPQPRAAPRGNGQAASTPPIDFQTEGVRSASEEHRDTPRVDTTEALPDETEFADAFLTDDSGTDGEDAEEVAVSPFGFGPYPELPEGWPPHTFPTSTPEHELLTRVQIKLISEGVNAEGVVYGQDKQSHLIYPIIRGIVYVEWRYGEGRAGMRKYIGLRYGHPADASRIMELEEEAWSTHRSFPERKVPSNIKLVPFTEAGIDPYEYLDLE